MVALKVSSLKLGIARCEPVLSEPRATQVGNGRSYWQQEGELTEPISRKRSRLCRASTAPSNRQHTVSPAIYATHRSRIAVGKLLLLEFQACSCNFVTDAQHERQIRFFWSLSLRQLVKYVFTSESDQHFGEAPCLGLASAICRAAAFSMFCRLPPLLSVIANHSLTQTKILTLW